MLSLKSVESIVEKIFGDSELVKCKSIDGNKFVVWTDFDKLEDAVDAEDGNSESYYVIVENPDSARVMIHELYDNYSLRHQS